MMGQSSPFYGWDLEERCDPRLVDRYEIGDSDAEAWLTGRARALTDLYWLCTAVFQHRQFYEPLHRPLCEFVQSADDCPELMTNVLVPRGHFKTTVEMAFMSQCLARNPNERIGLFHAKKEKSQQYLGEWKTRMSKNVMIRWLFPDVFWADPYTEAPDWKQSTITVKRTEDGKTPSIVAGGVEAGETGLHFTKVMMDDIVHGDNVGTQEMREKTIEWRKDIKFIVQLPKGPFRMFNFGTRWHPDDAHQPLVDGSNGIGPWAGRVRSFGKPGIWYRAALELPDGTPSMDGEPILPDLITKQELMEELSDGSYKFSCHRMNNPTPEGVALFKRSDLVWYRLDENGQPPIREPYEVFTGVDPNRSEKTSGDPSAIISAAWTQSGHLWILQITRGHQDWRDFVGTIAEHAQRWNPREILLEVNAAQIQLQKWVETGLIDRALASKVIPVESSRANKKGDRIISMQGLFESHRVHLLEGMEEFAHEAERYTGQRDDRDDQLDALSYICQRVRTRRVVAKTAVEVRSLDRADFVLAEAGLGFDLGGPTTGSVLKGFGRGTLGRLR